MNLSYHYDVIVIGSGIAGLVCAVTANAVGKRTALVEKRTLGGNCANFTCVPSKALVRLSHLGRDLTIMQRLGFLKGEIPGFDGARVFPHIREIVRKAFEKDRADTFENIGIHVVHGAASFKDPHTVEVEGRAYTAGRIIIAVGTIPFVPPIPGLAEIPYLTNESVFDLPDLPKSVIILGGGVDGLEYASSFARLGVETTVVEAGPSLLPFADREAVRRMTALLRASGVNLLVGTKAVGVKETASGNALSYEALNGERGEVQGARVLVTVGRRPDLEGLGLDNAGVRYTPRGVVVNDRLQTSAKSVYACGDVAGPYQLASTAEYQGIIAAINAFSPIKQRVDYRNNVYLVFTDPPLAYLGLTEAEAHAKYGHALKVFRFEYDNMRRAMIDLAAEGMGKVLCDGGGRIVGAHILGEGAGEVIHELLIIRAVKKPIHRFHDTTHAYPTYAQALVGRASQLAFLDKMAADFFVRAALRLTPGFAPKLNLARDRLAEVERDAPCKLASPPDSPPVVTRLTTDVALITLPERLTHHGEQGMLAPLEDLGSSIRYALMDFSQVRFMNGLAAMALIKFAVTLEKRKARLIAFGLTRGLRDVFRLTELDRMIMVSNGRKNAYALAGAPRPPESDSETDAGGAINTKDWADPVERLAFTFSPPAARKANVAGRKPVGPVNGFGQLWQKVYRLKIRDPEITPVVAFAELKKAFPELQPSFNHFYPGPKGIAPGEIVLIDSITPGGPVSTGVMTMYADELSFTFVTPQGHPEAGWINFSAYELSGHTIVQIAGLTRAGDPVYEAAFHALGSRIQARIWIHALTQLAARVGVPADVAFEQRCVDRSFKWDQAWNIRCNAQIITLLREPFHQAGRLIKAIFI